MSEELDKTTETEAKAKGWASPLQDAILLAHGGRGPSRDDLLVPDESISYEKLTPELRAKIDTGTGDPEHLISEDAENILTVGSDDLLFVPEPGVPPGITEHMADDVIHVTADDKAHWNTAARPNDITSAISVHNQPETHVSEADRIRLAEAVSRPVQTADIADMAVTRDKVADWAIGATQIENFAIWHSHIRANAVGTLNIADGHVTEPKLADNAVSNRTIRDRVITERTIAGNAVAEHNLSPEVRIKIDAAAAVMVGKNWMQSSMPREFHANSICGMFGVYIAVGSGPTDRMLISTNDGLEWFAQALPWGSTATDFTDVCWNNTDFRFLACARDGSTAHRIIQLDQAMLEWSNIGPTMNAAEWRGIAHAGSGSGSRIVVVGRGHDLAQCALVRQAGTWLHAGYTIPAAAHTQNWSSLAVRPSPMLFVAVADELASNTGPRCMTSENGVTWTERTLPAIQWKKVIWVDALGLFVAIAQGGTSAQPNQVIATSTNGVTWTMRTVHAPSPMPLWQSICWTGRILIAVGRGYEIDPRKSCVMYSHNAIDWTFPSIATAGSTTPHAWTAVGSCHISSAVAMTSATGRHNLMLSPGL